MGWWGDLTGKTAAETAMSAARDQYGKQTAAGDSLRGYGDYYAGQFRDLSKGWDPYVSTGLEANTALANLMRDPSSVRNLPGYQFSLDQGLAGLDRSAAAKGMLNSGKAGKDVLTYATGLADQTYGNQLSRLMQGAGLGMQATGSQIGTVGQGLQGQLGTRNTAYAGDMDAAKTMAQGQVAAAQAKQQGMTNLFGMGASILGTGLGAALGGPMGASLGGSLGKMMGGGSSYGNMTGSMYPGQTGWTNMGTGGTMYPIIG